MSRRKICLWPGCNRLTAETYCFAHAIAAEKKRKKKALDAQKKHIERIGGKVVYSTQHWQKLRKAKLAQNPLCERCGVLATLVHHRDHNSGNMAWENLESLCADCHRDEHKGDVFKLRK